MKPANFLNLPNTVLSSHVLPINLKNGVIYSMKHSVFGTDGIRGVANTYPMTPEMAIQVGKALVVSINHTSHPKRILIGKDTRISGYIFETALTSGICAMGGEVLLTGPLPTPAVAHLTKSLNVDAGIMISASHNDAEDNGIKFFHTDGYKFDEKLEQEIEDHLFSEIEGVESKHLGKAFRVVAPDSRYIEYAKQTIDNISLKGLKVVLDCANGAAYKIGPQVLSELGAKVIPMNIEPDGQNINLNAGVFHPEAVAKKVLEEKADLGAILDGDADRLVLIDEKGDIVDGNGTLSIIAIYKKQLELLKDDTVVATVMANMGFHELMSKNKIKVVTTPVGDKFVSQALRENNYSLGGESSGHIMLSDLSTTADGIVTALKVIQAMRLSGKSLSVLNEYKAYPQVLLNFAVSSKPAIEKLNKTQKAIAEGEGELQKSGRILVRYSGTENIARVMVEGKSAKSVNKVAKNIAKVLKQEIENGKN